MVTTRAAQDPTGGISKDSGDAAAEEQDTRLVARLRQLVADEGRGRAAEHLGVDRKTVWQVLNSQRLNPVVREALLGLDAEVSDSDEGGHDDAGVRELRHRIAILEDLLPDVERQLAQVGDALAELRDSRQAAAHVSTPAPAATSGSQAIPTTYIPHRIYPERVVLEPRPDDEQVYGPEVFALITEWREQHAEFKAHWPTIPGYEAEIAMVELEVELIGEHELSFSTNEPPWPNWRRRQELQDRAERREVARHKLRKKADTSVLPEAAHARSLGSLTRFAKRAIAVPIKVHDHAQCSCVAIALLGRRGGLGHVHESALDCTLQSGCNPK